MEGGCACGTVRYRLASPPYDAGWCHCRLCQRIAGSAALAFGTVPLADFVVTAGAESIGKVALTSFGERQFCSRCGSPLTIHVAHQADEIDFTLASLDHPDSVAPGFHIFVAEAIAWATIDDGLPRHQGFRPETRGLQGRMP